MYAGKKALAMKGVLLCTRLARFQRAQVDCEAVGGEWRISGIFRSGGCNDSNDGAEYRNS
jgi:hypothetical protein